MSYITAVGTANPPNKISQSTIGDFMVRAMQLDANDARKLRALYRVTGIETRYSVLEDYSKSDNFSFFSNTPDFQPFPSTKKRLELFRSTALKVSLDAIRSCLKHRKELLLTDITHLVVVSCTGMYAPGLDIDLVRSLGLPSNVQRVCINFMGCYAAFNAMKVANSICDSQDNAKVLVICTELCSLHFQKANNQDNLLANALFGDGSAVLLIESKPAKGVNLIPQNFYCDLITEGANDMAWTVGDEGFEMKLSAYVPDIIKRGIGSLTKSLLNQISGSLSDVSYFAVHPGGKKILEVIEQELGITKEQNQHAYNVLRDYGNMSSATVLFVLCEIYKGLDQKDNGKKILSFAFGPGLTLESLLLKIDLH